MLNSQAKNQINLIQSQVQKILSEILRETEGIARQVSNPNIGVFRKSQQDAIEEIRKSYRRLGKRLKRKAKNMSVIQNSFPEIPIYKKHFDALKELKESLTRWGNILTKACEYSYRENIIMKGIAKYNTEIETFAQKFTSLAKNYVNLVSPPKEKPPDKCPSCNEKIDTDSTFCKYCGVKISAKRRVIPKHVKQEVWERDSGQCIICGKREGLEFDHIIPFSKGGANTATNLQLLCSGCNKKKYNKIGF